MSDLTFADVPRGGKTHLKWNREAEQLRSNPGRWALIATKMNSDAAHSFAVRINTGSTQAFRPAGHFEAVRRHCETWARYVGGNR